MILDVHRRAHVFGDPAVATAAVQVLRVQALRTGVPIHAFCVMPDHIHLVLEASAGCDIITFVGQYKNLVQREAWRLGVRGAFWQKSFWDRFIRGDAAGVVRYVLRNPVRAGIVERWRDYAFSGSLVLDVASWGIDEAGDQRIAPTPP